MRRSVRDSAAVLDCAILEMICQPSNTPGREQTNNRAGLQAAITAMRVQDVNLEIGSDNEYVVRTAAGLFKERDN